MGAYLSEPKTSKESSDAESSQVRCGASSMQGWRITQEDAHNCILDFDEKTSLFAVYDGHGGHEVAEYCAKKLPDFIRAIESYKKKELETALRDSFLGFDATLTTPEVVAQLAELAGVKDGDKEKTGSESSEEEEDAVSELVQEAHMPLDEVMAKYSQGGKGGSAVGRLKREGKPPVSPMLHGRRAPGEASSSSASSSKSVAALGDSEISSSSGSHTETKLCNGDAHFNGEVEEDEKEKTEETVESDSKKKSKCEETRTDCNNEADSSGISNGGCLPSSGGGGSDSVGDGEAVSSSDSTPQKKRVSSKEIYTKLLEEDSDDSEEEDETFIAADAESDSDDDGNVDESLEGEKKDTEDNEDSSDEDDEEDEEEEDDIPYPGMEIKDEPGWESGCTAVVALLAGSELYVANAGDSRAVVCRRGQALDMSADHKPEDEPERERIEAAGGKVTCDGRVNGGLNLSRAIGDHSYKQVALLPASRQMITALPDIKKISVEEGDYFLVLACDGIWNSMTSQEVVDFVRAKLEQKTEPLSQICEELFDHCLAPHTQGDGTGCDNMTCVIVQFKPTLWNPVESSQESLKRPAEEGSEEPSCKKSKAEEAT